MQQSAAEAPASAIRLGTQGVTRRFGPVVANDRIDFRAERGTVHAIVGGNGAGKSTLMRMLQGMDKPDEGVVLVDGRPTVLAGPADAFARGIGMVHQEFMLVPALTLLENLVLASEPTGAFGTLDKAAAIAKARELEKQAGVTLDWSMPAEQAPVHARQIVEILRLLYRGADVLILDEPTAVLAPAQVAELIALLRKLRDAGRTILFISHKLDEVLAVADVITVIRNDRVAGTLRREEARKATLAELMIGEVISAAKPRPPAFGPPVASVRNLTARGNRGLGGVVDFDLTIRQGEIVGIAGVAGNGQDEIAAALIGLLPVDAGSITFAGRDISRLTVGERRALGLAYLSPDRRAEGLCLTASIADNAIAGSHRRPEFCGAGGVLSRGAIRRHVSALLDHYSVKRGAETLPAASLSGGNQQRVAVARELDREPKLLLACQPTRGVDIRGIDFIHSCLLDYRDRGGSVILISEELEELLTLSDRIIVVFGGRMIGEAARGTAGIEEIGRMMLGDRRQ